MGVDWDITKERLYWLWGDDSLLVLEKIIKTFTINYIESLIIWEEGMFFFIDWCLWIKNDWEVVPRSFKIILKV